MKLSLPKNELNRALQVIQCAVAKRTTMPILSNILLSASNDQLSISASDLELSATATVKAAVKSAGKTTVSAKVFSDIVRELGEGDVSLNVTEGDRLEISTKNSKFKIVGVSAEEYPTLPGLSCKADGKVVAKTLLEMINRTIYAVSLDETRFNLNGVCFEKIGGGTKSKSNKKDSSSLLRFAATDGHRLALITRPIADFHFEGKVIVPRKGLSEMRRLLEQYGDKEIAVGIADGFFVLETNDTKMSCRLIDSEYPDYSQVLPQQQGPQAIVNSGELSQALKRVMLMVTDREKGVRATFSSSNLRLVSSSPELGEASEEIAVEYKGEVVTIGFNAMYLLDVASTLSAEEGLRIELHGEVGPGKFSSANDDSYIAIVMPMRL